jgi:hypothetical protein
MELVVECSEGALLIQPERSPPVIDRAFDYRVDTAQPLECFRCAASGRMQNLCLPPQTNNMELC